MDATMEIIYKYGPFRPDGSIIEFQGEPVHVGHQEKLDVSWSNNDVFLWAKLKVGEDHQKRKAMVVGTGEKFQGRYIGSVIMPSKLVWHVVEI